MIGVLFGKTEVLERNLSSVQSLLAINDCIMQGTFEMTLLDSVSTMIILATVLVADGVTLFKLFTAGVACSLHL